MMCQKLMMTNGIRCAKAPTAAVGALRHSADMA